MGRDIVNMREVNRSKLKNRVGILVLAFLLCAGVLVGCGKEPGKSNVSPTAVVTPSDSVTPTATSSPTPTVPYCKTAYETVGRDDVYSVPVKELEEQWFQMGTVCRGDYVLMWFNPPEVQEDDFEVRNTFVLLNPAESGEQYRITVDFPITEMRLLANGTVLLEEQMAGGIHVYDNKMTEVDHLVQSEGKLSSLLGVSEDGILWQTDEETHKLVATDLKGQKVSEYECDPQYTVTRYLGVENGRKEFLVNVTGKSDHRFMYISENGEVYYRNENEGDLGDDWLADRIIPISIPVLVDSASTWFFHAPGYLREGFAFPKSVRGEQLNSVRDGKLCSCSYRWLDDNTCVIDHRLYDLEKRTVSGVLTDADIPDCLYLSSQGTIGDGIMVFNCSVKNSDGSLLLLWNAGEKAVPIENYCDLAKDDIPGYISSLVKKAEECGVKVTPDRTEDDGTNEALGDILLEMELINTFVLASETDPELLKTKSGEAIHPENKNNNDGAAFTFQPHIFSTFYLKEHGEKRRDAFYAYVDAIRAGEDRYRCASEADANWSSGRFAMMFFPFAGLYADATYVGDGWAEITYLIPKDEFLRKEREFEERVEKILNDVLEEDYSDLEKALALYEFMTEYIVYDYDMMYHNGEEEWSSKQSPYRVLDERQGICGEIAILYQYLGLQCGIDVDEVVGAPVKSGEDTHAWNYVRIDGTGYLLDATWGLTTNHAPDLCYFLFTDQLRETRDGYAIESYDVGFVGMYGARKKFSFECNDERYSELWKGKFVAFDEAENCIFYTDTKGNLHRFDYAD